MSSPDHCGNFQIGMLSDFLSLKLVLPMYSSFDGRYSVVTYQIDFEILYLILLYQYLSDIL